VGAQVLVAVASRHGSTWEIGQAIGSVLRARGIDAEVRDVAQVDDLTGYGAVVVGSAVYTAHWLPSARDFVNRHADDLAVRPVWLFSSGLATQPAASANSPHEIAAVATSIGARGHRSFRGKLDREVLSFTERAIIAGARGRDGDHRDFEAIAAWSEQIAESLVAEHASV
jgi:menaquinone-dependent protoporphyrinogen oxidase